MSTTTPAGAGGPGLRSRVTITFAVVTLVATLLVSATTFFLSRRYLIDQRERSAVRQTFLNARLARDLLESGSQDPQAVLDTVVGEAGTVGLLRVDGQWYASAVGADPAILPESFVVALDDGVAARQRTTGAGGTRMVVGVPLLDGTAAYVEVASFENVERTFRTLLASLLVGSAGTTLAGALIGVYVSRRLLRPLDVMTSVAATITAGDRNARLSAAGDRDLESLVRAFNEMVDALEERIEREQRFTSDVSHELRTPLTVLKTATQVVEQRAPDLPPRHRDAVRMLAKQVDYFERLVLDLLEVSRFDAGVERVNLEETDLVEFLEQVARVSGGAPVRAEEEIEPVLIDRRRVERILSNIIENAQRYGKGVAQISLGRSNGMITIRIDDRGVGVPEDERGRIFERFWRGRDARHQETRGSGLGLALVAEHVRLLGGSVHVEDAPSGGARFRIDLPERAA